MRDHRAAERRDQCGDRLKIECELRIHRREYAVPRQSGEGKARSRRDSILMQDEDFVSAEGVPYGKIRLTARDLRRRFRAIFWRKSAASSVTTETGVRCPI